MSRKGCPNKVSKKISFTCLNCGKNWLDYPCRFAKKKYCSKDCSNQSPLRIEVTRKRSIGNKWGALRKITPELRKRLSIIQTGKKRPNDSKAKKGAKNPNWKGGVSPENKRIRRSSKFFEWRKKVFERDNYTCRKCNKRGNELHPHHIKPFSSYPKLRFEISNGLTLCAKCHRKTDSWSFRWCKTHSLPTEQK